MKNRNKQFGLRVDIETYPNEAKGVVFTRYTLRSFRFGIVAVGEAKAKLAPGEVWNEQIGRAASTARAKKNALRKYYHELTKIYDTVADEMNYLEDAFDHCNDIIDSIKDGSFGQPKGSI